MCTKVCIKCGEEKELKDFYKNKTTKDGYANACKSCVKKYERSKYVKREKEVLPEGKKRCSTCKGVYNVTDFSPTKRHPDGLSYDCRSCARAKELARVDQVYIVDANISVIHESEIEDFNRTLISLSELPLSGSKKVLKYLREV